MTAPGWYNAEGDPVGSQRYWDGAQWIGEPVYEPAAQAAAAGVPPSPGGYPAPGGYGAAPVAKPAFSSNLKTVAIVLSVLKAIPLIFLLIGVIILGSVADDFNDFDEFGGIDFDGVFGAIIAVFVVMFLIGAVLLFFQMRGAIKEKPMMLFVAALIMVILDALSTLGAWSGWNDARDNPFENTSVAVPIVMTLVLAAQAWVAVQAIKTHNART